MHRPEFIVVVRQPSDVIPMDVTQHRAVVGLTALSRAINNPGLIIATHWDNWEKPLMADPVEAPGFSIDGFVSDVRFGGHRRMGQEVPRSSPHERERRKSPASPLTRRE